MRLLEGMFAPMAIAALAKVHTQTTCTTAFGSPVLTQIRASKFVPTNAMRLSRVLRNNTYAP